MSTLIESVMFERIYNQPHRSGLVISHSLPSSRHLLGISKRFHEHLRDPRPTDFSSRAEVKYSAPHDSEMRIETASNIDAGASFTIQDLHCSELPRWPDPKELLGHMLPAVPDHPDTMIIIETTAVAFGDYFHQLWLDTKAGETDFEAIFLPWFIAEETTVPIGANGDRKAFEAGLDDEERALKAQIESHGLPEDSLEQLNWRRATIRKLGSVNEFRRQYPANDEECFLVAGTCRFDVGKLREMMALCEPPSLQGGLVRETTPRGRVIEFRDLPGGMLSVWEEPKKGGKYVIGADTSEGVEGEESGLDPSSVHVIDAKTLKVVATIHGYIDPDLLGEDLADLGWWYNNALVAPEANNHGLTTCKALQRAGYTRIFWRRIEDDRTRKRTRKIGWLTSPRTRGPLVDNLAAMIREGELECLDSATIGECLGFVRHPDGKYKAAAGGHDDRVVSLAIAAWMVNEVDTYEAPVDEKPEGAYIDFDEMVRDLERENRSARMRA
ncbi:hypothetical protein LCGC14_0725070 [marine sediment metagenome]|uniref:Terminase large subunit gp17-like C-terminal domain-containing protein n=1 Tax=marine sediment metagenome TaxID=412755 RepID=A0A0F9TIG9_9ZZZZ